MTTITFFNQLTAMPKRLAMVLTVLFTIGVGSMWGAEVTVTWTASSGALGNGIGSGTIKTGSFSWDYTRTLKSGSTYTSWTSNCIQLGKNGGVENITFTTSAIPGTIKNVSIECASYQGKHNVAITVGGKSYLSSTATSSWTTVSAKSGSGTSSGTIQISLTGGTRALYIKSISVTYEENSGSGGEIPEPDEPSEDACGWVEADISEITSTDNVVITMSKGDNVWALANNNGTGSAPTALLITIANGEITPAEDDFNYNGYSLDHYTWNISTNSDKLTFYPKGSTSTWLYCTDTNNGVRVGTNTNKTFTIDASSGYLKHTSTSRYVGVYPTNPDWRCYDNTTGNIAGQTLKFYKYVECAAETTVFTVTFDANGGSGSMEPQTFTVDVPQDLSENKFTRNYYTFKGWTIDKEGSSTLYENMQEVTVASDVTLYAQWTPIEYTITLDANQPSPVSWTATHADGLTLPTATPCDYAEQNGWTFAGWKEDFKQTETTVRPALYTGKYYPTRDVTLHAVYAKTGTAQGAAGEFILSLQYEGTTYYVGQTFDNSKLSAETNQANAARFTIEDNYLHYEGGYISHVATTSSPNITKQADKANAQAWTITEEDNTITFTSTADDTRGLGFNYNEGSPRFAAYKLNEKDGETIKYPSTFTKTSVSGGNVQVTTYNSNPSCEAPVNPTWQPATINFDGIIQVECGSKTLLNAADPNGPATITFNGYNLQNSVTVTASDGFFVSTDKVNDAGYKSEVTITPHKDGQNVGKLQNVYVIAQAPAQSGDFTGTITLTGADITNGSQVINVTAAVTCTQYTITWSVSGDETQKTTFYAGGEWTLPEDPTFDCNGRVFVGWTNNEIVQPQDIAPNVLYKEQSDFPTIESNTTFYAVFAKGGTDDGTGTATVTDVLNREWTEVSGTTYKDWNGKTATSSAVYTGNSAGGNESIQLRSDASKDAAGIITTTSGGKATNITVVWNNQTADGRTLNVYGKNSAYSAVADLRNEDTRGTLLGTIVNGTSTSLTINNNDYEYIGLCSNSGAMYLTSIAITWETEGEGDGNATTYTSYTTSCADVKAIRIVEPTTKTFNEGDKFVFDGKVWAINSDDSETDVTNSPYVRYDVNMYKVGTQTVTVSYLGFTATYEITINAVDKWQITWNVSGATNTGLSPVTVAKGIAIGTPPTPKPIPSGCTEKSFIGWTESNVVNADGSDITYLQPSDIPTKHTTYYAVFATPNGDDNVGDIFYESFNTNEGIGGNDETWNNIKTSTEVSIDGWSFTKGYVASQCIRLGTGDVTGSATTPALGINGSATLTFNAGAWDGNNEKLNIILYIVGEGHIEPSTFTLTKGQFNTYTANITGANADTKVQFIAANASNNRFFLDEVRVSEVNGNTTYTDYTTGCHDVTITYYGFTGGYTTNCGGDDLNVITQRVNSSHTIPYCTEISDPTTLGRTFLGTWKDQNGKERKPGDNFIVTENITFYAQWALNTSENTTLPTDVEDLATTDIVVTGGTTLTLQAGTTTINSLTLKGGIQADGSYKMPIIYIPDNATLKRKSDIIYLDLVVNAKNYYPFAVPFRAKNGSAKANWDYVGYIDPVLKEAATYRTHFVIKTYDGAKRAENGENRDANWVIVNRDTYLEPGVGYMITAMTYAGKDTVTMRIPMRVSDDWFAGGEKTTINDVTRNTIAVTAHTGAAATEHQRHAGWNFVASPYLSQFAGNNVENNGAFINGEILIQPGFDYGGYDVPYVTIPAYDFSYYDQVKLSEAMLSPEYSFFVQIGTDGTMNFTTAGRQQAPAALRANAPAENPRIEANLAILSNEVEADHTGLIIDDRYTSNYEIGADLEKMFGSAYNTTIYTISQSTRLAYNALPHNIAQQSIPLGFRAAEEGEYTISLTNYEDIVGVESIILHDLYTGLKTNLLHLDYTFDSEATQDDNRFVVYIVARDNTTTDISTIVEDTLNKQNRKVLINNHLYIIHEGKMYNGVGQIVK